MNILSQTFYIDPNAVNNSSTVYLTGIDLFFKAKPSATNNQSGITNPGIHLSIVETNVDTSPSFDLGFPASYINLSYSAINADTTATTATTFTFTQPIPLNTGQYYAIRIQPDDPAYDVWTAVSGDALVGTNSAFPGFATGFQGGLYSYATDGNVTPTAGTQLKFNVRVAQFTANSATFELVNRGYEFLAVSNQVGTFAGGELAFTMQSNVSAQTVSFTAASNVIFGNNTVFTNPAYAVNNYIIMYANTTTIQARQITSVINSTAISVSEPLAYTNTAANFFTAPTGIVYFSSQAANTLYLTNSNANSSLYFVNGANVVGAISGAYAYVSNVFNLPVTGFNASLGLNTPSGGTSSVSANFANSDFRVYTSGPNNAVSIDMNTHELLPGYNAIVMSRSNEVQNPTYLYGSNAKSSVVRVTINQSGPAGKIFTSPYLFQETLDMFTYQNYINNSNANENTNNGNAASKHITTILTFDSGISAQDSFLYLTAFKPAGTQIIPYAKVYNSKDSDSFNQKEWTLMVANNNTGGQYSTVAANNYLNFSFGMPNQPPSKYTANGAVSVNTSIAGNATLVGTGTNFGTEILVNDVVKVYNSAYPNVDYQIAVVTGISNSTVLTLDSSVSNTSVTGAGSMSIDKIADPYQAFLNPQNNNVIRYYNSSLSPIDTYDSIQYKVVLLSNNINIAPRISSLTALGVSV